MKTIRLQFITHSTERYSYYDSALLALEGGCRWIQLRMKDAPSDKVEKVAIRVQQLCKDYHAIFIINDHVEIAKKLGADGVHLGKMDMSISKARSILGNNFIIGATANSFEDVKHHYQAGANYIGLGPYRFTETKKNLSPILGIQGYIDILSMMEHEGIEIPLVAIGGITNEDLTEIFDVGVSGVALSSGILQATNPIKETARILQQIKNT